ncbi:hypothetical protein [Corynebacterium silvaticum]|uniref:Uncharacterized protein n=1 Tax=Corynebacterium silvaticum TaxID=2320431 RepID=A0ACD4PXP9_9CORY|nr:hypothetical protein [Corynebacterium silvaticum]WCV10524.1 hypothetical protein CBE74_12535 [Corynebacterium silvaticum]
MEQRVQMMGAGIVYSGHDVSGKRGKKMLVDAPSSATCSIIFSES